MAAKPKEKPLTEDEAAAYLGWEVYRLRVRRTRAATHSDPDYAPRSFRIGNRYRYLRSELDRWLAAHPHYLHGPSEYLNNEQLAEHLGVTLVMLRNMRGRYKRDPKSDACPPYVRCGRQLLYAPQDVDAWLKRQQQRGTAPPPEPPAPPPAAEPRKPAKKAKKAAKAKKTSKRRAS